MSATGHPVFTIGHSNHPLDTFMALLQRHRVTALADVRSAPYSRLHSQFSREPLAGSLQREGIEYVHLGQALGGRSDDPACYEDGRVRYDRVAGTATFRHGLDRVVQGAEDHLIALLCAEREPLECHRTLLVARALDERGIEVAHIHADGGLESHAEAMDRLLQLFNLNADGDLFRTAQPREELVAAAIALQAKRVAYVDRNLAAAAGEANP